MCHLLTMEIFVIIFFIERYCYQILEIIFLYKKSVCPHVRRSFYLRKVANFDGQQLCALTHLEKPTYAAKGPR